MKNGRVLSFMLLSLSIVLLSCHAKHSVEEKQSYRPLIGVTVHSGQDPFTAKIRDAISEAAHEAANLIVMDSQNNSGLQDKYIDSFMAAGAVGIAVNAVDRLQVRSVLEKAKTADIPVVFFNREPMPEDMQYYKKAYYVGAKAAESGIMQGKIAVDYFKHNPHADKNHDGMIQYVMLTGDPMHQDSPLRTQNAIQTIKDAGMKVEALAEDTAMWRSPEARKKMAEFITQFGSRIELVLANNDEMALGAISALQEAGYLEQNTYIPVLGVDAIPPALDAVEKGLLLGTVLNDAEQQGMAIFELVSALAENRATFTLTHKIKSGKYIWIPYQMITKANVQNFRNRN